MTRPIGFRIRKRNSSHASSLPGPAQRNTISFNDKDEYFVCTKSFDTFLVLFAAMGISGKATREGPGSEVESFGS